MTQVQFTKEPRRRAQKGILQAGHSIRTRLLALLLGLTIASVVTIAYLSVSSILNAGQSAQQASSAALRAQAKEHLVQLTAVTAEKNNLLLENVRQDAKNVAQYAAAVFERPEAFASDKYWRAEDHMFRGPQGQYINGQEDTCTVFVPNSVTIDDKLIADLELASYLDLQFIPVYTGGPNRVAVYFISKREFSRLYPNIGLGDILEPDYMATKDIFFTAGAPENNPKRQVVWTPVYDDPAGQGLLVTTVAPVYTSKGEFLGIIGIDVSLAKLGAEIEAASPVAGGYSFLVNDQRRAIALPKQGYADLLGRSPESGEFGADLSAVKSEFAPVLAAMMSGSEGFQDIETGGQEVFVAYAPLAGTQWSLSTVVEAENMLQAVAALQKDLESSTQALVLARILPAGVAILVVAAIIGFLLTNRLVDPIQKLAAVAQEIGAGRWNTMIPQAGDDEIGVLSSVFEVMVAQIRELVGGLEQRVAERTAELREVTGNLVTRSGELEKLNLDLRNTSQQAERRATQLAASAQVAHAASQVRDLDQLLPQVTQLISQAFGYYHVGVFIVDEAGRFAVLRAANSEGGQRMLARSHKLTVGKEGIVGYVTGAGQPRIALDVGADAVHFDNPDLPQTRSEMALPLQAGERTFGALDVQSTQGGAFTQEDVAVLGTLADQIAIAIENARLFTQTQAALQEAEETQRRYMHQEWGKLSSVLQTASHEYRASGVPPVGDAPLPEIEEAIRQGRAVTRVGEGGLSARAALAMPIKLRDQLIGVIDLQETDAERQWTDDDVALVTAVADQVALALENVRLFEQTRQRAQREQLISQVTAKMRAAPDIEAILRTTVREVRRALGASQGVVRLGTAESAPGADQATSRTEKNLAIRRQVTGGKDE
jgi:GAF domain-containing protein/HAMP domain-containing protein